MTLFIVEARKSGESIYLTGYFKPKKNSRYDMDFIEKLTNVINKNPFNSNVKVFARFDTILIENVTYLNLSTAIKTFYPYIRFNVKPTRSIKYSGGISEKEIRKLIGDLNCIENTDYFENYDR